MSHPCSVIKRRSIQDAVRVDVDILPFTRVYTISARSFGTMILVPDITSSGPWIDTASQKRANGGLAMHCSGVIGELAFLYKVENPPI